jgi:hypothetical protein
VTVRSRPNENSDHRRHDRLLITRHAAGDSYPAEQAEAEALVAGCSDCRQLADDIRLLSRTTQDLPAPRRSRDFRISVEQAERLRGTWFERLMRGLASPGWGTALRPMAGAAMAIGLTLAVVGALPLTGTTASQAPAGGAPMHLESATHQPGAAPMASLDLSEELAPAGPEAPPADRGTTSDQAGGNDNSDPDGLNEVYIASPAPADDGSGERLGAADAAPGSNGQLLLYAGLLVAALGTVLLLITWIARRRFGDALLR